MDFELYRVGAQVVKVVLAAAGVIAVLQAAVLGQICKGWFMKLK